MVRARTEQSGGFCVPAGSLEILLLLIGRRNRQRHQEKQACPHKEIEEHKAEFVKRLLDWMDWTLGLRVPRWAKIVNLKLRRHRQNIQQPHQPLVAITRPLHLNN